MDGLIHISELSWSHVNHPSEVLEIGQEVKVKVLDIDRDRQRISLGLKQTQSDPWQQVLESYSENDVVEGRVTKVVTFGAFVEILPGVEGLVHISELAQHHVENPREVVSQGDAVNVLDPRGRRRAPPPLALAEAGRGGPGAAAARRRRRVGAPDAEPRPLRGRLPGRRRATPTRRRRSRLDGRRGCRGAEAAEPREDRGRGGGAVEAVAEPEAEEPSAVEEPSRGCEPRPSGRRGRGRVAERRGRAEPEPELEDAPAPESDAAAEVELEAESTADADAASGDDEPDASAP